MNGANETRATLVFASQRRGAAAWLAAPAPSGALEFVSANATLVIAGLSKSPVEMFDEMLAVARAAASEGENGENPLDELAKLEAELGFSLRDDLAAALGGDAAVAIDGPLLPKPSWKVVVEVVDPSKLEYVLGRAIEAANRSAAEEGRACYAFRRGGVRRPPIPDRHDRRRSRARDDELRRRLPGRRAVARAGARSDRASRRRHHADRFAGVPRATAERRRDRLLRTLLAGPGQRRAGRSASSSAARVAESDREQIEAMAQEIGPMLVPRLRRRRPRAPGRARGGAGPLGLSFEKLLGDPPARHAAAASSRAAETLSAC